MSSHVRRAGIDRVAATVQLVGWLALLGTVFFVLIQAGHGALAGPPVSSVKSLLEWTRTDGALLATMALLRLLALVFTGLLLITTLTSVVNALRARCLLGFNPVRGLSPPQARAVSRLSGASLMVHFTNRLARKMFGLAVVTGALVSTAVPDAYPVGASANAAGATMVHLPSNPSRTPGSPAEPSSSAKAAGYWTIHGGDNLWSIAAMTLQSRFGRAVTDGEIASYWVRLISANSDQLVHPGQPDLIYPGQVFRLP